MTVRGERGTLRRERGTASGQERLRNAVKAAEAYTYHKAFLEKSPERYQPETLRRLLVGADVQAPAYIQGRREVDLTRRPVTKAFEAVDVVVTPTTAVGRALLADVTKDVNTSIAFSTLTIRNTSPFNVYGGRRYPSRAVSQDPVYQSACRSLLPQGLCRRPALARRHHAARP